MAAVDIQNQEGPSARTLSAVLDAAAERLTAAGVDNARADAEVLVADAMGVKPQQLSVESAGEVPAEIAAAIEERVARAARGGAGAAGGGGEGGGRGGGGGARGWGGSRWPTSSAEPPSARS